MILAIPVHCFTENPVLTKAEILVDVPGTSIILEDVKPNAMCTVLAKRFPDNHVEERLSETLARHSDDHALKLKRLVLRLDPQENSVAGYPLLPIFRNQIRCIRIGQCSQMLIFKPGPD
jgi:hypothetical protein